MDAEWGMEYDIEAQDRYKNQYINNKNSGKGDKNHSSTIVCSGTSLPAPGCSNWSIPKEKGGAGELRDM